MLDRGDQVPHFTIQTISGERIAYSNIWQQKHLLLIALPVDGSPDASAYISRVDELMRPVAGDAALVVTRDPIAGLHAPAAVVADRWGEVAHVAFGARVADLPAPEDLLEWIEHVRQRCPECEGESR